MRKMLRAALLILFVIPAFATPINLSVAKQHAREYVESGQYMRSLARVYHKAKSYLANRINQHKAKNESAKLAVVMDIDETLLSNYQHMKQYDFGGDLALVNQYIEQGDDPVFPPALRFARFAKKHHVAIFLVTGRSEVLRNATERNLKQVGVPQWEHLYMRPAGYQEKSIVDFKAHARANIERQGYVVVESIGDQWSDIKGGHVEKGYKLPNPFYFIP